MSALPAGTVTFLFTDVESSTRLLQAQPRAYARSIARHHELLAAAVARHGGVVFETVGDAVYAAFAKAADALAAAVDGQLDLSAEPWGELGALRVRMGLHTGEVEVRGDHYFGAALYRCARIMSAAHGGQVILSRATAELVADTDATVALRDLGTHRLKDLQRPEHVLQVMHPDLPADFPPLRSLNGRPNNLPILRTETVGRDRELAAIAGLLGRDDVRLVTLIGAGGIGKTRLALSVAADQADRFAHGVFVVALAALRDPALVGPAIAGAIGLRETPGRDIRETLHDYARDKQLLLVLDNFEHLIAAASTVGDLLAAATGTKVLVTSQAPLRLYGEQEFDVPPLAGSDSSALVDVERSASVQLFLERARDIRSDFTLTAANAPIVAQICARLDGLPLAIELAAARVRLLSPEAMLERLDRRLPLLIGGARDLPQRQQTLRNAMDWSFSLLEPAERSLFARLSVFAGGCTLEDAEAVLPADDAERATLLDGLESLLAKSLVRRDARGRFSMLATIREFAREQLVQDPNSRGVLERHAKHFAAVATIADERLHTGEQLGWLDRLDAEADNMREALGWCFAASGDPAVGAELVAMLLWYWFLRSRNTEASGWLERVTPGIGRSDAYIGAWAAFLTAERGANDEAVDLSRRAVAAARQGADDRALVLALSLSTFHNASSDWAEARIAADEAVATARTLDDFWSAYALAVRGEVARAEHHDDAALGFYAESRTAALRAGERLVLTLGTVNPAHILLARGDGTTAKQYFRESLSLFRELGNTWGMAYAVVGLGGVANAEGRSADAVRLLGAADAHFTRMGIQIQPTDRPDYERYVADARARLGDGFADAWREAHALSLEDAAALDRDGGSA